MPTGRSSGGIPTPETDRLRLMENARPHPLTGAVFEANVRVAGLQYKRVSGQEFAQITVLVPWSPDINARAGAIAGKVCAFTAREVVDPVLREMFRDEVVAEVSGASPITGIQRTFDNLPPVTEGDDGIPPDETSGLVR